MQMIPPFTLFLLSSSIHWILAERQAGYYCYGDGPISKEQPCRFFGAVIDAGSTGTRLHLYRYVYNQDAGGIPILVEKETFEEVKPGLSSFHEDVKMAAVSIRGLVNLAQSTVPHFMWEKTPITLKATAGLRLLPGDIADDILTEVEEELFNSGFFVIPNGVSVLSGSDEGLYSWLTLNLLLNVLYSNDPAKPTSPSAERSAAAFDLGGGSTQLTYWPSSGRIFNQYPDYERDIDFFGNKMKLFTHSFLGNGLVAARLNVLTGSTTEQDREEEKLTSECLPDGYQILQWEYALRKWDINGTKDYSFEACYGSVMNFIERSQIMKLTDLRGKLIYLFGYYYDRGLNSNLVKDQNGGRVLLSDFKRAAEEACTRSSSELAGAHWLPWQCHDLTYIYSLLHDGYGFADDQPLFLAKKIKDMEVAWAQGLSYALINEFQRVTDPSSRSDVNRNETMVSHLWSYISCGTNTILTYFNLLSTDPLGGSQ